MTFQKNLIAVHFSAYAMTNLGQSVCITGNCIELGMWDPSKGFKLQTNIKQYPIWFSKNPINLQKLTTIDYKLCILGQDGKIIRWENLKQNRTLVLKTSCSIFLTEDEQEAEYDYESQDSSSTQINSSYKGYLSQIQQRSDDDEPSYQMLNLRLEFETDKKRPMSSKRTNSLQETQNNIHYQQLLRSESTSEE